MTKKEDNNTAENFLKENFPPYSQLYALKFIFALTIFDFSFSLRIIECITFEF